MAIKLSKVIKNLNIGRQDIEEFLHTKGIEIDASINARIQGDVYVILIQHFRPELAKKLISNYKRTKDYKRHNLLNKTDHNDSITNDTHVTYPLISEYVEAIKLAEDNLDQLSHLRPVLDKDGRPVMSSGNFAVVFKMKDENDGKLYALKCFTREQVGRKRAYQQISKALKDVSSPYLVSIRYLANELFVNSKNSSDTEFPVVVMDWVNGQTLDNYIKLVRNNQDEMNHLTSEFFKLAGWLLKQPFAHGDLKPDNILVQEDGSLVLVDYDGMYVPAMKGQPAREIGSPNFRLPNRDINTFDRNIDDFPITTISLALRAITLNPDLLDEFNANDALLFVEDDFHNIASCKLYHKLCAMLSDNGINQLILALHLSFTGVPIGDAYLKIIGDGECVKTEKTLQGDKDTEKEDRITVHNDFSQIPENNTESEEKLSNMTLPQIDIDLLDDESYTKGVEYEQQHDYVHAVDFYRKAALSHNSKAQYALGICYYYGRGVKQNYKEAFNLFSEAVMHWNTEALSFLGRCFYFGRGVDKDYSKAYDSFKIAAKTGNLDGQLGLAVCLLYGRGVDKDQSRAIDIIKKLAEQGHPEAQHDLGYLYEKGNLLERDVEEAIRWYEKSKQQGYVEAQEALTRIYNDHYREYLPHSASDVWVGCEIHHIRFGCGKITRIDTSGKDDKINVLFDDGQTRWLLLKFAKFQIL